MELETKYIIFGSQKGGVGKSTLCNLLARYICNYTDKKIVVLETDPQASMQGWRDNELDGMSEKEREDILNSPATYQLIRAGISSAHESLERLYGEYDYVLCDLIGTLQDKGVIEYHLLADLAFAPLTSSDGDVNSTADYLRWCKEKVDVLRAEKDLGKLVRYMLYVKQDNTLINRSLSKGDDFANLWDTQRLDHGLPEAKKQYAQNMSTLDFRDVDHKFLVRDVEPLCKEMFEKMEALK